MSTIHLEQLELKQSQTEIHMFTRNSVTLLSVTLVASSIIFLVNNSLIVQMSTFPIVKPVHLKRADIEVCVPAGSLA